MAAARINSSPTLLHLVPPNHQINMASFALLWFKAIFKPLIIKINRQFYLRCVFILNMKLRTLLRNWASLFVTHCLIDAAIFILKDNDNPVQWHYLSSKPRSLFSCVSSSAAKICVSGLIGHVMTNRAPPSSRLSSTFILPLNQKAMRDTIDKPKP